MALKETVSGIGTGNPSVSSVQRAITWDANGYQQVTTLSAASAEWQPFTTA